MKKLLFNLFVLFLAAATAITTALHPNAKTAIADTLPQPDEQQIETIFKDFVGLNQNRYSFNVDDFNGEQRAAQDIKRRLIEYGYGQEQVVVDTFSAEFQVTSDSFFNSGQTETRHSQNVVLRLPAAQEGIKNKIIIGCDYDNTYSGTSATVGAIDNASGTAVLLALAQTIFGKDLPVNVDIVFFGAGYYNYSGSGAYVDKYGVSNVAAMINVTRAGMSEIFAYCDEIPTPLEDFVMGKGGIVQKMPSNVPLLNAQHISGYPYTHIGMAGNHSQFMSKGVPCINIFGGDTSALSLMWTIEDDSIEAMESKYPSCYKSMQAVCALLIDLVFDNGLASAAAQSKSSRLSPLMKPWIAYLIFTFVAFFALFGMVLIARHYAKKYPFIPQKKSISVFGEEYE